MSEVPRLKFILIGDSGTGKTCILFRFVSDTFYDNSAPTVGVDVRMKEVSWKNSYYKLALYDTAGQERFKSLTPIWYRNAHGVLLVYSITDRESFLNVQKWLSEVNQHCLSNYVGMLVGNKTDLEDQREVSTEEAQEFARENNLLFLEVSAKSHQGSVDKAFEQVLNQIITTGDVIKPPRKTTNEAEALNLVSGNVAEDDNSGGYCC